MDELYRTLLKRIKDLEDQVNVAKKYFSLREAAEYCSFSKSYLYKLIQRRVIPSSKPNGRKVLLEKKDLDAWISKYRTKSTEELERNAESYLRNTSKTKNND